MPDDTTSVNPSTSIDVRRISPAEAEAGIVELFDGDNLLATTFYRDGQTLIRFALPADGQPLILNATALRKALDDVRHGLESV